MASELSAAVSGGRDRNSTQIRISALARRAVPSGLAAAVAAGLLAACGSAGAGAGGGSGAAGTHGTAARSGIVLSVRKLPGIGAVLADRSGSGRPGGMAR